MLEAIECHRKVGFFAFAIRLALLAAGFGRGGKEVDEGLREHAADVFTDHGEIAAKMKSAPGPGTLDYRGLAPWIADSP